ncbi:TFPI [Mytilus coruscus]|uniref:TFPI n=1 Tax=Mytilus coruscus TaxID=42192 RepID=A0A6J8C1T3_MYTCO|nr:TFPI [Mytilus coruscus]
MFIGPLVIFLFSTLTAEAQQSDNVCDLPKIVGPCKARMKRFYYDVNSGMCGEFYYGGCDGNENNFKTKEECKTICRKRVCTLPQIGGPECERSCNGVKKDPCGQLPPCPRPPFGSCFGFSYRIINGVKCITGCNYECPQKPCPKDPIETCSSCNLLLGSKCDGDKICCSGCCRDPVLDPKPGKCPIDPSQLTVQRTCYLRKSDCERDSQCDGKRKCCRFSCRNFCVDPDK